MIYFGTLAVCRRTQQTGRGRQTWRRSAAPIAEDHEVIERLAERVKLREEA